MIIHGDCLEKLKTLEDNSIDAVVTDPPYGLSFMGKKWDYDVPSTEIWEECLRVLKPGGYLLAFAGTRTQHRMAVRIEDAGFEIRDMIAWVYGSGFPKSRNIGLDIDKRNGVTKNRGKAFVVAGQSIQRDKDTGGDLVPGSNTMGAYKAQNEWSGWGTALKPALEPITVARKPLAEKTVAENCLKWGVGGINIDGSRVEATDANLARNNKVGENGWKNSSGGMNTAAIRKEQGLPSQGRFPANFIHDGSEEVVELFPNSKGMATQKSSPLNVYTGNALYHSKTTFPEVREGYNDNGSAARFFYCAKASKSERNMGCEELGEQERVRQGLAGEHKNTFSKNFHPTVKPIALMEYLVKLVSREGAIVLDPFMGSGSTGIACKKLNRQFIGIEREADYVKIANARINAKV